MSAMKIINQIHDQGGKITSFTSHCGVLPAPEANTNPLGYKFSWSPRGVLLASRNAARFLKNGKEITVPGEHLFQGYTLQFIPGFGYLEGYPNRDSLIYQDLYGIPETQTLLRGTLRYIGWCEFMKKIGDIGLLNLEEHPELKGMTFREFISKLVGLQTDNLETQLAHYLHTDTYAAVMKKIKWLGLLGTNPVPSTITTPLDLLADRMMNKLRYNPGERDMAILHHEFTCESRGKKQQVTSTFIGYGDPQGDSAVARTVALPAAIGTHMLLQGKIALRGVQIPLSSEIYTPVLQTLEPLGVVFSEKTKNL
jgi:saccharopine dehydrogenase (NADP+, L-glutamate forming)/spermidine synthase